MRLVSGSSEILSMVRTIHPFNITLFLFYKLVICVGTHTTWVIYKRLFSSGMIVPSGRITVNKPKWKAKLPSVRISIQMTQSILGDQLKSNRFQKVTI